MSHIKFTFKNSTNDIMLFKTTSRDVFINCKLQKMIKINFLQKTYAALKQIFNHEVSRGLFGAKIKNDPICFEN